MTVEEFKEIVKATDEQYVVDEIKPFGHVSFARGTVPWGNHRRKVSWDSNGKCLSEKGKPLPQFDLVFNICEKIEQIKVHRTNGKKAVIIKLPALDMTEAEVNRVLDSKYGRTGWVAWVKVNA